MRHDFLFAKYDFHGLSRAHHEQALAAPANVPDDRLLNTPTDDLMQEIMQKYRFDIPVLHSDEAVLDHREGDIQVYDTYSSFGGRGPATVRGNILELSVPFSGDKDFFFVQPTTHNMSPPRAAVSGNAVSFTHSSREVDGQQAETALKKVLQEIEQYLEWLRGPVKRTAVSVRTSPPRGTAPFKPEPVLDDETYDQILQIMENMAHVMERSPSAFETMGEEALRQHFLVQLNGQFEGAATGETFNFEGKTDILIRVDGRNIFIAECKFWGGEKAYLETIDQLLGYLSWRDTKTAVVIFNRNKDFSNVLRTISDATEKHPQKKRGPDRKSETHLRYVFGNPKDANRELQLAVMVFDIPKPS